MSTPCSTAGGSAVGSSGSGGAAPAARLNEAAAKIAAMMLMILPIDPHAPPRVNEAGTTIPHGPERISRAALRAGARSPRPASICRSFEEFRLLCRRAVDIGLECGDELVLRPDAGHRDQQRLVGKAGFEREVIAGEDVTGIVGAPVKEVVIVEVEQLVRQPAAVRRLPQVDVGAGVRGIDDD